LSEARTGGATRVDGNPVKVFAEEAVKADLLVLG
jgi:hypothetical protein